jgi:DhnA family fructose-bisphosphate aldolase class Ia
MNWMSGLNSRLLSADGNAVVVAMDHGMEGVPKGFENPRETLLKVLEGEPDGILCTPNLARTFAAEIASKPNVKVVARVDFLATSVIAGIDGSEEIQLLISDAEECMEIGADAAATFLLYGRKNPAVVAENIRYLSELSRETHRRNLPLVTEVPFWGKAVPENESERAALLEHACRIAWEVGSDIIKAPYLEDRDAFRRITSNLPAPILVLGGVKTDKVEEAFTLVAKAMEDGARGVFFGRNIWQHEYPDRMVTAMKAIIHEGATVDEATRIVDGR